VDIDITNIYDLTVIFLTCAHDICLALRERRLTFDILYCLSLLASLRAS